MRAVWYLVGTHYLKLEKFQIRMVSVLKVACFLLSDMS